KGERMTEEGMLSIVPRGATYQVRYASSNPHGMDHRPYPCPDERTLFTLLHACGLDAWGIQQASTELRKGRVAVLPRVGASDPIQAYFPPHQPAQGRKETAHTVGTAHMLGTDDDPAADKPGPAWL